MLLAAAAALLALRSTLNPAEIMVPGSAAAIAISRPDTALQHQLRLHLSDSANALPRLGRHALVEAFYAERNYAPAWHNAAGHALPLADSVLRVLSRAAAFGLDRRPYHYGALLALHDSLQAQSAAHLGQQSRDEALLTDALLQLFAHLQHGRVRASVLAADATAPTGPVAWLQQALQEQALANAVHHCQPASREYRQLQPALAAWLQTQPDWAPDALWQQPQFWSAAFSLERWRQAPVADTAYVLLNLPAYELQVLSQGRVVARHRVVIGKPQTPSPTLSSRISYFTTAADWHAPRSIPVNEILPCLRRESGYLAQHNYALYS
ncbi:hypothetical protein ASU33_10325 [Solirubrum puertoriconensis]|uniref:Uncharacterized protein n=1 Tax=Solirubrum puertoriconensis TaxID=1751427 RepID=A0A9X0HM71_SOLP1|nr:hypothetical protein ASU33_10325 [Solirubrum puertoriconensis]